MAAVAALVALLLTGLTAVPALALDPACPQGEQLIDGDNLRTVACYSWRSTYVVDPGRYNTLGYQDLWQYHSTFNQFGFSDNDLWYGVITQRTFEDGRDSGVRWAHCAKPAGAPYAYARHERPPGNNGEATGLCIDVIVPAEQSGTVLSDFQQHPVTLDVLQVGDAFIALACGNFSVAPATHLVPRIAGTKYHDRQRNGTRDPSDEGLGGWQVRLVRDTSDLVPPQPAGFTGLTVTTAADGSYAFDLVGQGPGTYHVEEVLQPGYVQTAAPAPVHVAFGAGSTTFGGNDIGNVEDRADVAKLAWEVVASPSEMHARVPAMVRLRATITNNGPAPVVDATDVMTATGPADCVFTPAEQSARRSLNQGEAVVVEFGVMVTCADPSFHDLVFANRVSPTSPDVEDPEPANNARVTNVVIPVFDDSDVAIDYTDLDCPERIDVDTAFACTVSVNLVNHGPYGPTNTDVTMTLTTPEDCTVTDAARTVADVALAVLAPTTIVRTFPISCDARSYHPLSVATAIGVRHLHIRDLDASNDTGSASDLVQVFQEADLSVAQPVRISCSGRLPTISAFGCDVTATIGNAGPATGVATATTVTLTASADCAVAPQTRSAQATLDAGTSVVQVFHFDVSCTSAALHTLLASVTVASNEPHAEDRVLANNQGQVRWGPTDIKPRSEPSAINLGKEGVVPVAILSTPTFNAWTQIVHSSLRWGVTGTEPSLAGCGGEPEDTNLDGYPDLVCRFDTKLANLTCSTTQAILTGVLVDGTPFESNDPVKVVGCKK